MTEEAELQAKIAAISGKINQHRQHQPLTPNSQYHQAQHHALQARWSPYGRGGRGGKPFQNRTLILGGSPKPTSPDGRPVSTSTMPLAEALVSTRAPGRNQLMNKDTYDREQKQKQKNYERHERARTAKRHRINHEERSKLTQHTTNQGSREIFVEGLRFRLRDDGSKLIRIPDVASAAKETPRKTTVADVNFFRTKNGNLVRATAVKGLNRLQRQQQKPQCEHFIKHGTDLPFIAPECSWSWTQDQRSLKPGMVSSALTYFLGNCPRGPMCKFAHDPEKVAICKAFLHNGGKCPAGEACDMSHDPSYHRMPGCSHFLRGNCTNDACRYPHVYVSPTASVCRPFATLGYCEQGEMCSKRHVFECPDYANDGKCDNTNCSLPHIDRASVLRKAAAKQAKLDSEDNSDVSSDDEEEDHDMGLEDIDSDEAEDVIMGGVDSHELSQQQDYVAFA